VGLLVARARGAFAAGDMAQARVAAERALAVEPAAAAHVVAGAVAHEERRFDEAALHFGEALRLEPASSRASYGLGRARAASGQDDEAIAALARALELDPGLAQARIELAGALERRGRPAEAAREYSAVLAGAPLDPALRLRLAFALIRAGRHAEARDRLRGDVRDFPDEPAFAHALARLHAASPDATVRDAAAALALVERLREPLGGTTGLAETAAMALAESGRFEEAVRWQREALEAARRAGRADLLPVMQQRLGLYETRRPCREPWPEHDEALRPPAPA
jgi:tetratricopeptide (TPR) repeat protein